MPVPGLIVRTRMVADVQPFGDDAGKYRLLRRSRIAGIVNNAEHDASDHDRKDDEKNNRECGCHGAEGRTSERRAPE